jgi:hypothetical protein
MEGIDSFNFIGRISFPSVAVESFFSFRNSRYVARATPPPKMTKPQKQSLKNKNKA